MWWIFFGRGGVGFEVFVFTRAISERMGCVEGKEQHFKISKVSEQNKYIQIPLSNLELHLCFIGIILDIGSPLKIHKLQTVSYLLKRVMLSHEVTNWMLLQQRQQNLQIIWFDGIPTPLKNISQLGWLFPIYGKIKNVPNHQPVIPCLLAK